MASTDSDVSANETQPQADVERHCEVRIHGVSGTPPRDTLYTDPVSDSKSSAPTSVYKRRETDLRFDTTAFRWANLTSGSKATALWILLAPYAIANAAGWMAGWRQVPTKRASDGSPASYVQFGQLGVRAAGLALTGLFVVQAITAAVLLPYAWLQSESKGIIGAGVRIGIPGQKLSLSVLVLLVSGLFYWLVVHVFR